MSYADEILIDDPLAWWRFRQAAGGPYLDEISEHEINPFPLLGNNTVSVGSPTGPAMGWTAAPNTLYQISSGFNPVLGIIPDPTEEYGDATARMTFSVEFWIKALDFGSLAYSYLTGPQANWSHFLFHLDSDGSAHCGIGASDGIDRFSPTDIPAGTFVAGEWHHVVYTIDEDVARFYVDGVQVATDTHHRDPVLSEDFTHWEYRPWPDLRVNSADQGRGGFSELAIYDHALTSGRVLAHYNAASDVEGTPYYIAVREDDPRGYWRRDEEPGSVETGAVSLDSSGNDFHGQYYGPTGGWPASVDPGLIYADPDRAVFQGDPVSHSTADDYTTMPASAVGVSGIVTVEFWIKWDALSAAALDQPAFRIERATGLAPRPQISFSPKSSGTNVAEFVAQSDAHGRVVIPLPAALDGNIHHIVCVARNSGSGKLYYDGDLVGSAANMIIPDSFSAIFLGKGTEDAPGDPDPPLFTGALDEVAVYDYELSADRVRIHYEIGAFGEAGEEMTASGSLAFSVGAPSLEFGPVAVLSAAGDLSFATSAALGSSMAIAATTSLTFDLSRPEISIDRAVIVDVYENLIEFIPSAALASTYHLAADDVFHISKAGVGLEWSVFDWESFTWGAGAPLVVERAIAADSSIVFEETFPLMVRTIPMQAENCVVVFRGRGILNEWLFESYDVGIEFSPADMTLYRIAALAASLDPSIAFSSSAAPSLSFSVRGIAGLGSLIFTPSISNLATDIKLSATSSLVFASSAAPNLSDTGSENVKPWVYRDKVLKL